MHPVLTVDFLKEFIRAYLILTFVLTGVSILRMYRVRRYAADRKRGKNRITELVQAGRMIQVPVYSAEEIRQNKKKAVVRLSVFRCDEDKRSKAVIICPGGGYAHLCTKDEGYPLAAALNEMGYTAFVLEYRTGLHCSAYAPMEDLAAAIKFIENYGDRLQVDMEGYAIMGFSAGGNLCGMFGSREYGYAHYGVRKPGCIILGYPWTNVNHWLQHPYWNIWVGLFGMWLSERGNIYMFGFGNHFKRKNRESLCVQNFITPEYPPVYMFAGGNDILVPSGAHTDVMEKALKANGVPYLYEKFFAVPHGVGLGIRTGAEGWLLKAVDFWEQNVK